jgi:hypothetical protein
MIQITLTELQALLRTQRENCATSAYHNPGSLNYILNAPTPDLSHLKEVEDVTSEGNTNQASVEQDLIDEAVSDVISICTMNGYHTAKKLISEQFQIIAKEDLIKAKSISEPLANNHLTGEERSIKWVKASERLPEFESRDKLYFIRYCVSKEPCLMNWDWINTRQANSYDIEWLDESAGEEAGQQEIK